LYSKGGITLKITFLGTGTSQGVPVVACKCNVCLSNNPKDKRLRSSILIETDNLTLVIDAGPDFRQQMLRENVLDLSAILLTHEHYDHLAGLDDIRAFNWVMQKPIDVYAERRVTLSVKRIFSYVFSSFKYPGIPEMVLHQIDETPFFINGLEVIPIRGLHHQLPVLGFRIGSFAYLTDMKTVEEKEMDKLMGLDCLVIGALRKESHISHFTLGEALNLVSMVNPATTFLTHVSHQMGKFEDISIVLPNNVFLAYDGLQVVL
jgi:phosphoribosyl 1,2-cyclic phosphate phosphodiesterase